jgi:hypothetical protein
MNAAALEAIAETDRPSDPVTDQAATLWLRRDQSRKYLFDRIGLARSVLQ